MGLRIEDYALIGDCQTAALVGTDGSVDWLCFPRFDSGACFAALLGTPEHGRWLVAPAEPVRRTTRRYRPGTLVLETTFETDAGAVTLTDFMPPRSGQPDLVRLVTGVRGTVRMRTEHEVRPDYGCIVPWVRKAGDDLLATAGPDTFHLRTPVELRGEGWATVGRFDAAEGRTVPFVLTWHPSHVPPPEPTDPFRSCEETTEWWRAWSSRCECRGP